jgi:hypothetical protein
VEIWLVCVAIYEHKVATRSPLHAYISFIYFLVSTYLHWLFASLSCNYSLSTSNCANNTLKMDNASVGTHARTQVFVDVAWPGDLLSLHHHGSHDDDLLFGVLLRSLRADHFVGQRPCMGMSSTTKLTTPWYQMNNNNTIGWLVGWAHEINSIQSVTYVYPPTSVAKHCCYTV